ncbi:MAG: hypothetical protein IKL67_00790, partial [Tidjanibacter sp.]|nr:hypothetical protein [Tidjanibacter sp.]
SLGSLGIERASALTALTALPKFTKFPKFPITPNFEFWQMRVSERKGCLLASKGSKECKPNIYTKQATPVPSGSILDKTTFCQF